MNTDLKQGISLPLAQFSTLITLLPHIETVLAKQGETIPRPDYSDQGTAGKGDDDEEKEEDKEEDEEESEEEMKAPLSNGKKRKKNFEATSEEDG